MRVGLAAVAAYVVAGLLFATGLTLMFNALAQWPMMTLRPWNTSAFVEWFIHYATSWPRYVFLIRGFWEIFVLSVYFATLWFVYQAASRRSAPRRLKSAYPDTH